ncbi:ferredoxin [Paraburkholderia steynii]|uniref:Ferredoxin n=1 Tax=Paraburkholderia steynii TaxID=1245441 RepID=A0A4R0XC05_9BURK|nr:ferredoxin [Paraburkholderia steynii]
MVKLTIKDRAGRALSIESETSVTLMEAIRNAGIDELLALCGGSCSCATCHVYISPAFSDSLSSPSADEIALLECSDHRTPQSRLACQIVLEEENDGIEVVIAPEN